MCFIFGEYGMWIPQLRNLHEGYLNDGINTVWKTSRYPKFASFYAFRVCYKLLLFCCSPIIIIQWHFFVVFYSPGITLDQRIEYISRAVLCAKSCNMVTSVGGEGEFLHELEEKMEVCVHVYILCLCGQKTGEIGDWVKWVVLHWSLDWPSELAGNTVIGIGFVIGPASLVIADITCGITSAIMQLF